MTLLDLKGVRVMPSDILPPQSMIVSRDLYDSIKDQLVPITRPAGGDSGDRAPTLGAVCTQPGRGGAHELYIHGEQLICRACGASAGAP